MTHSDLILYAYTFRSRAERVIWALDELELDYQLVRLNPLRGETRSDAFRKIAPQGKVPVLVHGERVFTESLAIMEYLDSLNPDIALVPTDPLQGYRFRHLVSYALSELEAYLWIAEQNGRLSRIYSWPEGTGNQALEHVRNNIGHLFDSVCENEFACGGDFTLADIYLYHLFRWASSYDVEIPGEVMQYMRRLSDRPAIPEMLALETA